MRENRSSGTTFYCFSPPVMLATFIIEIVLFSYVLVRYKLVASTRLVLAILFCLALFQLAEYNVCGRVEGGVDSWSRAGFAAITLLPALGIHLIQNISKRGWTSLKWAAYASAGVWLATFAVASNAFNAHVCGGNYIIFHLSGRLGGTFYIYYYFWIVLSIVLCAYYARTAIERIRQSLIVLSLGYCVFFIPTVTVNKLKPETTAGLPSIMCGFAVLYALILVLAILPRLKIPHRR